MNALQVLYVAGASLSADRMIVATEVSAAPLICSGPYEMLYVRR